VALSVAGLDAYRKTVALYCARSTHPTPVAKSQSLVLKHMFLMRLSHSIPVHCFPKVSLRIVGFPIQRFALRTMTKFRSCISAVAIGATSASAPLTAPSASPSRAIAAG
ncbi:hypothetical protein Vretimale_3826, partial [Volvox reticuliferus]